ncbi:MAG TPA: hypothetical protein VKG25_04965 [Bryobacteraceae bacterium]|nr:hypothetical protein [Bryobacteraceae bacterium]
MKNIREMSPRLARIDVSSQGRISASLFYELAKFVSWGSQNPRVVNEHPELGRLLESSAAALSKGGVLEYPAQPLAA